MEHNSVIMKCVSKRIHMPLFPASQQEKKAQLNYKQFTSHFPVSWAPGQLKMMDASNFFNTEAMQITFSVSPLAVFPHPPS